MEIKLSSGIWVQGEVVDISWRGIWLNGAFLANKKGAIPLATTVFVSWQNTLYCCLREDGSELWVQEKYRK